MFVCPLCHPGSPYSAHHRLALRRHLTSRHGMELEQRRSGQGRVVDVVVQLSGERLSSHLDAVRRARHSDRRRRERDNFRPTEETRADIADQFNSRNQPCIHGEVEPPSELSPTGIQHTPSGRADSIQLAEDRPTSRRSSSPASTAALTSCQDTSADFDIAPSRAEFDWVENLLDFAATSREPETTIHSPTGSSSTMSTPPEPDADSETAANSALNSSTESEHPDSPAPESEGRDDVEGTATSSTGTGQRRDDSSSSSSPSSSTQPSHLLNIKDVARSLSALLMANTTLQPDHVARVIAR